jgi:cell division protein FtsI/penicillin-binding protein 2
MVAIRDISLALIVATLSLTQSPSPSSRGAAASAAVDSAASYPADAQRDMNSQGHSSLFAQSAAEALNRDFPSSDVSFLLLDAHSGRVLASRWDRPDTPIPMGSLLKPFTALAYGEQHEYHYPSHICRGTSTRCWLPRGHGQVDLTFAIAYSCNSYFRILTAGLTAADVSPTATRFGLDRPSPETSGPELAGLGTNWRTSPLGLARAYLELFRERQLPGVNQVLDGMALSALQGTGAEVHRAFPFPDTLVKTGTAVCTHSQQAPGDGFTVVLEPADNPKLLLLVRVHGVPGARAARTAGQMLRRIEE